MKTSILTQTGLGIYDEEIKKYIQETISDSMDDIVLEFDNSLLFPTIGLSNTIYIDKTANKIYRWDSTDLKYYPLNDYEKIEVIDGCY